MSSKRHEQRAAIRTLTVLLTLVITAAAVTLPRLTRAAQPHRVGDLARLTSETRLRSLERRVPFGARPEILGFRAGAGLAALLTRAPDTRYLVDLGMLPQEVLTGGVIDSFALRAAGNGGPALGHPVEVAAVAPHVGALFLVPDDSAIIAEDMGQNRTAIAAIPSGLRPSAACLLSANRLAYVDPKRANTVFVGALGFESKAQALPIPSATARLTPSEWPAAKLSGGPGGRCVLWAPRLPTMFVVGDSALVPIGHFIEGSPQPSWADRVWRAITRSQSPPLVLDITSFPGRVAVLFEGSTDGAGRLLDFYSDSGRYLETLVLRAKSVRVAGYVDRFYAIRLTRDSILLDAYALPR